MVVWMPLDMRWTEENSTKLGLAEEEFEMSLFPLEHELARESCPVKC
jgi:hypothetical protein